MPGVESASITSTIPFGETVLGDDLNISEYQPAPGHPVPHALHTAISPGNIKTMGIPLLRGRDFADTDDENAPRIAVINEAMAETLLAQSGCDRQTLRANQRPEASRGNRGSSQEH